MAQPSATPHAPAPPDRTGSVERSPRRDHGGTLVPRGIQVAAAYSWRVVAVVAGLVVVGYVLRYFSEITIALLVSLLVAALVVPTVDHLDRHGWPRVLATLVCLLLLILLIAGLLTLVVQQVVTGFPDLLDSTNLGLGQLQTWLSQGPLHVSADQLNNYITQARDAISANSQTLLGSALAVGGTLGELVTGAFLVLFMSIFLVWDGRRVWSWLVRLLPRAAEAPMDRAAVRGWVTLTSYVRATIIVALVDALGIGIGAFALQIPLAAPLAVLVFLGAFIPIVGAVVSGAVAVLVGLVAQGWVVALIMLGVVLLVQQIESHILQPFLMGKAVSVHPLAVFIAIAAGSILAGIPGALFAVPTVAVINTIITYLARGDAALPPAVVRHVHERSGPPTDDEQRADDVREGLPQEGGAQSGTIGGREGGGDEDDVAGDARDARDPRDSRDPRDEDGAGRRGPGGAREAHGAQRR